MSIAELRKLPADEKIKILEVLWSDLASDEDSFKSPSWHDGELRQTEKDFDNGNVETLDWEDAKKELRSQFD